MPVTTEPTAVTEDTNLLPVCSPEEYAARTAKSDEVRGYLV